MDADILRALARGLHLSGTIGLFGAIACYAALLSSLPIAEDERQRIGKQLQRIVRLSGALALAAGLGWLLSQAAYIGAAENLAEAFDLVPLVATGTTFGSILLVRLLLVVLAVATFKPAVSFRMSLSLVCASGALLLQAGVSHPAAIPGALGTLLLLSHGIHVLAAGVWFGLLPPLWMLLRTASPRVAAAALRRFSPVGMGCVALLAMSAAFQGTLLIGSLDGLFETDYGRFVLVKLVLFVVLLAIAALNRWLLLPPLEHNRSRAEPSQSRLEIAVGVETAVAALLILAAAVLMGLAPSGTSTA